MVSLLKVGVASSCQPLRNEAVRVSSKSVQLLCLFPHSTPFLVMLIDGCASPCCHHQITLLFVTAERGVPSLQSNAVTPLMPMPNQCISNVDSKY